GILKNLPDGRHAVIRQVNLRRARPLLAEPLGQSGNRIVQAWIDREPRVGVVDGRLQHVFQSQFAEVQQRKRPGAECRGHGRREKAIARNRVDLGGAEPVDRGGPADPALAADGDDLAVLRRINEDRHFAADAAVLRLEDVQGETRGHGRVDGVAAFIEYALPGACCQIMAGSDYAVRSHVDRSSRKRAGAWHSIRPLYLVLRGAAAVALAVLVNCRPLYTDIDLLASGKGQDTDGASRRSF